MILIFLQNAYIPNGIDPYRITNRRVWERLLWRSVTGRRLKEMIPDGAEVYITESTTQVGTHPNDKFPPEPVFMLKEIVSHKPSVVLACGKVAQSGLDQIPYPYIAAPHPASRTLSKADTKAIRERLAEYA
jgi:hypothetical protein